MDLKERRGRLIRYAVENCNGWLLDGNFKTRTEAVKYFEASWLMPWRKIKREYGLKIRRVEIRVID